MSVSNWDNWASYWTSTPFCSYYNFYEASEQHEYHLSLATRRIKHALSSIIDDSIAYSAPRLREIHFNELRSGRAIRYLFRYNAQTRTNYSEYDIPSPFRGAVATRTVSRLHFSREFRLICVFMIARARNVRSIARRLKCKIGDDNWERVLKSIGLNYRAIGKKYKERN